MNEPGLITDLLSQARTLALVGASHKPDRPSYRVMSALQRRGYRVIPVNPQLAGTELLGETVYDSLAEIPLAVDFADLFVNSKRVGEIVDQAIALQIPAVWMQLGVVDEAAARRAEAAGLKVVMDRCPLIEFTRHSIAPPAQR